MQLNPVFSVFLLLGHQQFWSGWSPDPWYVTSVGFQDTTLLFLGHALVVPSQCVSLFLVISLMHNIGGSQGSTLGLHQHYQHRGPCHHRVWIIIIMILSGLPALSLPLAYTAGALLRSAHVDGSGKIPENRSSHSLWLKWAHSLDERWATLLWKG